MGYLGVLVLLGLLILLHELGHLVAAKAVGIPVAGFSVGFGPKVWSRRWGRTEYALRALPLGGFVLPAIHDAEEFRAFALPRRLLYFLGGPLANLALAFPLLALLDARRFGLSLSAELIVPFGQMAAMCREVIAALAGLFARPEALSGVVGIVVEGKKVVAMGGAVELALSLSVSLAVLNLLPIPMLDGGQILMGCLEELFPRLIPLRVPLTLLGMVLLAGLMIYANVHDVMRILGRPARIG